MKGMPMMRKPRLGTGDRFRMLRDELAGKGVKSPGGLAAHIGRRKYGAKKMAAMSAAGHRH